MIEELENLKTFEGVDLPEGHLTTEDQLLLKKYATGKKLVVDMGTFKGRAAIIEAIYAERVVTIDCFPKDAPNNYKAVKKELSKYDNIKLVKSKTLESVDLFKNNSIDLLIQDAGHSAENVIDDIKYYLPKLKNNAIIMIHDYKYMDGTHEDRNVQGGVKYLIDNNILKQIEISGWYWIGEKINLAHQWV